MPPLLGRVADVEDTAHMENTMHENIMYENAIHNKIQNKSILLVEDNEGITEGLRFAFEQAGRSLITAGSISEAGSIVKREAPGLVLLDVMLPDGDGFEFYRNVLALLDIPTIFLTARDNENDIVDGLELGAEDYITKPFSVREIMARVNRALARRSAISSGNGGRSRSDGGVVVHVVRSGAVEFDMEKMEVKNSGKIVTLSGLELKILKLLFENHDRAVPRSAIIQLVWEATGNDIFDHTVTVYVKRIREKLGADIIKTVKGIGYRIDTCDPREDERR